jgi:hypothetical protein
VKPEVYMSKTDYFSKNEFGKGFMPGDSDGYGRSKKESMTQDYASM